MSQNQFGSLWSINRASVLVEAVELAAKADRRAAERRQNASIHDPSQSGEQRPLSSRTRTEFPIFSFSPRLAAVAIGLAVVSGLLAVNWIA